MTWVISNVAAGGTLDLVHSAAELHNLVTAETIRPVARRRSPKLAVGASGATLGAHGGSTVQTWWGRSWATHAVSNVTTDTRLGSVLEHRPGETPATGVLSVVAQ